MRVTADDGKGELKPESRTNEFEEIVMIMMLCSSPFSSSPCVTAALYSSYDYLFHSGREEQGFHKSGIIDTFLGGRRGEMGWYHGLCIK